LATNNLEISENIAAQPRAVAKVKYKIISQLARIAGFFLKVNIHHDDIRKDLELSNDLPICYVINYHSFFDLLVLHYVCSIKGLVKPIFKAETNLRAQEACYLYFYRRGLYRTVPKSATPPRVLQEFFAKQKEKANINFNIVPVNIYWGRNPGKEESAFKLLFFDSENGGLIQRFFTVLFQSRRIQIRLGRSITLASMCRPNLSAEDCARKLRRICRIHFRQSRNILLGPQLYSRDIASKWVLKSPLVKEAIRESAEKNNQSIEKTQAIAAKMIWEISAEPSSAYVRFFEIILPRIFSKLYSGVEIQNKDVLVNAAEKAQIVYLPCHRSHLDYMLIGFFIHFYGLMSPHIGGGDNLNFFPVGAILRRAGAFFLRRKFGGNRLYSTIFNEYMHFLLFRGHPLAFFMEGGRSRSGRMLPPKTGMLAMVVHSYLRNP
jgi:glycerol-3-phosphate O-acyltransferase